MEDFPSPPDGVCQYTHGTERWPDERAVCADLDGRLDKCDLFKVYKECHGQYIQPPMYTRPGSFGGTPFPRIDRILVPNQPLVSIGWSLGVIGIECKAPGKKLGAVVSQCLDYSRAVFNVRGFDVMLKWVFIWPLREYFGDIASVMDQHRIGGGWGWGPDDIDLRTSGPHILRVKANAAPWFRPPVCGNNIGSR